MDVAQYNKNLPDFLHRTQEQLDAEQERQTAAKPAVFNYSEDAVLFNRALVDEQTAKESIENGIEVEFNSVKLAESYLEQGKFDLAAETHPDKRYRVFLNKIVRSSKNKKCPCPLTKPYNEQREGARNIVNLPNFRLWRMVYDGSPDKFISIYVCDVCRAVWKEKS